MRGRAIRKRARAVPDPVPDACRRHPGGDRFSPINHLVVGLLISSQQAPPDQIRPPPYERVPASAKRVGVNWFCRNNVTLRLAGFFAIAPRRSRPQLRLDAGNAGKRQLISRSPAGKSRSEQAGVRTSGTATRAPPRDRRVFRMIRINAFASCVGWGPPAFPAPA